MLNVVGLLVSLYTLCRSVASPNISFAAEFNYESTFVSLRLLFLVSLLTVIAASCKHLLYACECYTNLSFCILSDGRHSCGL